MAPLRDDPYLFTIITNDGLSDKALMRGAYMSELFKLKLHARQTESKRSLKRNKFVINKRR
jgi:hypothetical protein